MAWTIALSLLTCLIMIGASLFKPDIKVRKLSINTYWLIPLIGASFLLASGLISFPEIFSGLTANSAINPLKILALFLSMTMMSVFLDEVGFFRFLASVALKRAKSSQMTMFITLYLLVSVLTMFTSNDIIILTFTPFICYFAKRAKIDPLPYLFASFVAANTWSMMFIIGNPTNIYLASSHNIGFIDYVKVMYLPTILAGVVSFFVLIMIFKKKLLLPIQEEVEDIKIGNRFLLTIGLFSLGACTVFLTIANYIGFEMYLITLIFAAFLLITTLIYRVFKKEKSIEIVNTVRRLPWDLIPFIIAMFVIVLALNKHGVTSLIANLFGDSLPIVKYGLSSFLLSNLINNIPMSVLFSSVTSYSNNMVATPAVYASIIGSNLGAFLTPIGALAGMMWMGLLKSHQVKFSFIKFFLYGAAPSIIALGAALIGLFITI
ncbi:MAG: ArsB/NhaD family transporter [Bacilli bacterium]|nr:ArsB/NhaD family transporter [Bacilli bacterium]